MSIPDETLRSLAKGLFAEGEGYGFQFTDWVRFANVLLDLAMAQADATPAAVAGGLPLTGEHVVIRALEPADRPVLHRWMSDPSGRWFLLSRTTGRVLGLDELLDDPASEIGIVTLPDGRAVGAVAYLDVDREHGRAELRKIIGEPGLRGRGIGKEASRLWVAHGLRNLGLRKIYLYTLASNLPNIRLNESLGFRVEGVLRREVQVEGRAHDVLRMGLVSEPAGRDRPSGG